jgi:predicted nucleic acid-binding protein
MSDYMLDTNVFNRLLDGSVDLVKLAGKLYYATHIQIDEIRATRSAERRSKLENVFSEVLTEQLPTQSFVLDVSRLDEACLSDGELYGELLDRLNQRNKAKPNNIQDALIAETALTSGLTLVTEDRDLYQVVIELGGTACGLQDLLV